MSDIVFKARRRPSTGWRVAGAMAVALMLLHHPLQAWCEQAAGGGSSMGADPSWQRLNEAQRKSLEPLRQVWPSMNDARRDKWRLIADKMDRMPADARARLQGRMEHWARMTPQERAKARTGYLRFKNREARQGGADALESSSPGLMRAGPGATTVLAKVPGERRRHR